jgi:hypothetical protein
VSGAPRAEIVVSASTPACPRCGGDGLAAARVPHTIQAARGPRHRYHLVVLCATCDADAPGAAPLITFFHVHEQVTSETMDTFAALLSTWVGALTVPTVDPVAWEEEFHARRRGDL